MLGAVQSGRRSSLRLLAVIQDEDVIVAAREDARPGRRDPELAANPALRHAVDALLADERADYLEKA